MTNPPLGFQAPWNDFQGTDNGHGYGTKVRCLPVGITLVASDPFVVLGLRSFSYPLNADIAPSSVTCQLGANPITTMTFRGYVNGFSLWSGQVSSGGAIGAGFVVATIGTFGIASRMTIAGYAIDGAHNPGGDAYLFGAGRDGWSFGDASGRAEIEAFPGTFYPYLLFDGLAYTTTGPFGFGTTDPAPPPAATLFGPGAFLGAEAAEAPHPAPPVGGQPAWQSRRSGFRLGRWYGSSRSWSPQANE